MIVLTLPDGPDGAVPMKRFVLKSGREVQPDRDTGRAHVLYESEAAELEKEGWVRQASKILDSCDLHKVAATAMKRTGIGAISIPSQPDRNLRREAQLAELNHFSKSDPVRRVVFGELDFGGEHGRALVEHDRSSNVIAIAGVTIDLGKCRC